MSKKTPTPDPKRKPRSIWRGVVAGLVGGLVATAAKTYFDHMHTAHLHEDDGFASPVTLATRLAGHTLSEPHRTTAAASIPWAFGAVTGAAYGAAAELFPTATGEHGAKFGMAIAPLAATPLLAAEAEAGPKSADPAGFIVFGLVTETVRGLMRRFW